MDLKTTRVSFDEFVLTWDAPVEERNITGFAVYLTDRTNNSRVREEIPAVLTHTFQGLTPSTVYLADVASILHSGEGILSQQIPVETAPFSEYKLYRRIFKKSLINDSWNSYCL